MMINLWKSVLPLLLGAALPVPALWAQKAPQAKSPKEVQALQAVQAAKTPDEQIKAIDSVIENFPDTEFKLTLLQFGMQAAQQKRDYPLTVTYAERILEVDPKNIFALSTLASQITSHTREFDLDKEEKLAKAEKYANATIESAKDAQKPRPDITDEQWANAKKDYSADAHSVLGQIAMLRKKNDLAITEFKTAQDTAAAPSSITVAHLGDAYLSAQKYDDAIAAFDKAAAMPDASPQVKAFIASKRAAAVKAKGGATPPAPAPGATPPGQVEIKK
jgi:tetratricopeptide (TPR) repeat protein